MEEIVESVKAFCAFVPKHEVISVTEAPGELAVRARPGIYPLLKDLPFARIVKVARLVEDTPNVSLFDRAAVVAVVAALGHRVGTVGELY
jgi:hypothetical protein